MKENRAEVVEVGRLGGRRRWPWRPARCSELLASTDPASEPRQRPRVEPPSSDPRLKGLRGVAALLGGWSVVLAVVAAISSRMANTDPVTPIERARPAILGLAALVMGVMAMSLVLAAIDPARTQRLLMRGLQILLSLAAAGFLIMGIVRHDPRRDPWIVLVVFTCLAIAALARWAESRPETTRGKSSRPAVPL
jgi:hypothetical protein